MNYKIINALKLFVIIGSLTVLGGSAYYILKESNVHVVNVAEGNVDFKIRIPKIDVDKEVIPNVDPRDEAIYKEAFKQGVAHGLGTKFPGEIGNTYLYAHSTRDIEDIDKNAGWFTRLDELEIGDEFEILYGQGIYRYSIASREIIDPRATGVYTSYAPVQMVTLQTCYPRGEITERIIYKALLIEEVSIANEVENDSTQESKAN